MGSALARRLLVGTGGIGSGMFLELEGNTTLGRNESRPVRRREFRDACKLHIILHYPAVLLAPALTVLPVGRIGADGEGWRAREEMADAGMDVTQVTETSGAPTLFSVCFLYSDGSGGNLTVTDSASARVAPADVEAAMACCGAHRGAGIAVAAPEAPLAARMRLLELASNWGFFRAAAVTSHEAAEAARSGLLGMADLVALNEDEARALAGLAEGTPVAACLEPVAAALGAPGRAVRIVVTARERGAHAYEGGRWTAVPPCPAVAAVNTAGAGDAFLGGLLAAEALGLPFLPDGAQLATLIASAKVASRDTIHYGLDRRLIREHAARSGFAVSPALKAFLAA